MKNKTKKALTILVFTLAVVSLWFFAFKPFFVGYISGQPSSLTYNFQDLTILTEGGRICTSPISSEYHRGVLEWKYINSGTFEPKLKVNNAKYSEDYLEWYRNGLISMDNFIGYTIFDVVYTKADTGEKVKEYLLTVKSDGIEYSTPEFTSSQCPNGCNIFYRFYDCPAGQSISNIDNPELPKTDIPFQDITNGYNPNPEPQPNPNPEPNPDKPNNFTGLFLIIAIALVIFSILFYIRLRLKK